MPDPLPPRLTLDEAASTYGVIADSGRNRPLFFDGKFLTASDLNREQAYLLARQADLARSLGFGVVSGLFVEGPGQTSSIQASSIKVRSGFGLTPGGDTVFVPTDLTIDLSDVPRLENLNAAFGLARKPQPPFQNLDGLFVLGLRAVEYTANPTPVFPPSVQSNPPLQDGEVIEATAITLVPYDASAPFNDPQSARARAAREIFLEQRPPPLPAGVLPLAMVCLRAGVIEWIDTYLVRREAGDEDRFGFGFAPKALAEAHFQHYRDLVPSLPPSVQDGRVAASDFFEVLPPGGPLPKGAINRADFTQAFFPPDARIELAFVPEDELAGLMDESLDQPPIDLRATPQDNNALAVLVLAPLKRADYRATATKLQTEGLSLLRRVANSQPALLGLSRPVDALQRLKDAVALRNPVPTNPANGSAPQTADSVWSDALKKCPTLWYVRRRVLPYASNLSGTALPANVAPAIVSDPQSLTVEEGKPAAFRVSAVGPGTPTYQWYRQTTGQAGTLLTNATNSELELNPALKGDEASYYVVVTFGTAPIRSLAAKLTVVAPPPALKPSITSQPQDATAPVGTTARFSVGATGTNLKFQWFKKGLTQGSDTEPPNNKNSELTLSNVQTTADAGQYYVVVSNSVGSVTSDAATLTVPAVPPPVAPLITLPLQGVSAPLGSTVVFKVGVSGTAPMTFLWTGPSGSRIGTSEPSLVLKGIEPSAKGTYSVTVTNAAGSVSDTAQLEIDPAPTVDPPVILESPRDVTSPEGGTIVFTVKVTGTAPFTYQWRKNGKEITDQTQAKGAKGPTLTLRNVTLDDVGSYEVAVQNEKGAVVSPAAALKLLVPDAVQPPVIVQHPIDVNAPEGGDVAFAVKVTGTAPFTFTWKRNGGVIQAPDAPSLALPKVRSEASKPHSYTVTVSNAGGEVTSNPANVTFLTSQPAQGPRIVDPPKSITAAAGGMAVFRVGAAGTAPLSYQWQKDGADLPGETHSTLTLSPVQVTQQGNYTVTVRNEAGSIASEAAELKVIVGGATPPPVIVQHPVSIVAPRGSDVTLSVSVTGANPFRYEWKRNGTVLAVTDVSSFVVTNVQPSGFTPDVYTVTVSNQGGSVTSNPATVTVVRSQPAPGPAILRHPVALRATVGADVTFSVDASGPAPLEYEWRLRDTVVAAGNGGPTLALTNLKPEQAGPYTVTVRAGGLAVTSNPANLEVSAPTPLSPSSITQSPSSIDAYEGSDVLLAVGFTGRAPLKFTWRKDGNDVPTPPGSNGPTLLLKNVQPRDAGSYDVILSDGINGPVKSSPAAVRVLVLPIGDPPKISGALPDKQLGDGDNYAVSVKAKGTAPFTYDWWLNGKAFANPNGPTLIIKAATRENEGVYVVTVRNLFGSDTATFRITVG
jgi:hypothetical protein